MLSLIAACTFHFLWIGVNRKSPALPRASPGRVRPHPVGAAAAGPVRLGTSERFTAATVTAISATPATSSATFVLITRARAATPALSVARSVFNEKKEFQTEKSVKSVRKSQKFVWAWLKHWVWITTHEKLTLANYSAFKCDLFCTLVADFRHVQRSKTAHTHPLVGEAVSVRGLPQGLHPVLQSMSP